MRKDKLMVLLIFLTGCEYFHSTRICNQTKQDIELVIKFDPIFLSQVETQTPKEVMRRYHTWNQGLILKKLDLEHFLGYYLIKADSCVDMEGGPGRRPDFREFEALEIRSGDTLRLSTKQQMRVAFQADRSEPVGDFDLIIKR